MSDYGDEVDSPDVSPDFVKDPGSTEDYAFNWVMDLDGDTISSSTFSLPDGLTEVSTANDTNTTQIFVSGGDDGRTYRIINRITSSNSPPRTFEKTIRIYVSER